MSEAIIESSLLGAVPAHANRLRPRVLTRHTPGVGEQVAPKGIVGIDVELCDAGDPGAAADRRHDRRAPTDGQPTTVIIRLERIDSE
jgi:hypothetical protein